MKASSFEINDNTETRSVNGIFFFSSFFFSVKSCRRALSDRLRARRVRSAAPLFVAWTTRCGLERTDAGMGGPSDTSLSYDAPLRSRRTHYGLHASSKAMKDLKQLLAASRNRLCLFSVTRNTHREAAFQTFEFNLVAMIVRDA